MLRYLIEETGLIAFQMLTPDGLPKSGVRALRVVVTGVNEDSHSLHRARLQGPVDAFALSPIAAVLRVVLIVESGRD